MGHEKRDFLGPPVYVSRNVSPKIHPLWNQKKSVVGASADVRMDDRFFGKGNSREFRGAGVGIFRI